ncbi:MAG: hypothetical protein ACPGYT_14120 [Nitrospirales bacterium]
MERLSKFFSAILMAILMMGLILGDAGDAEARKKAKFRYDKPDASLWVNYCQNKHPDKTLKRCCARRQGSCQSRCKKSAYPNTAYETNTQCLNDCRKTQEQCVHNDSVLEKPKPKPAVTNLSERAVEKYQQCTNVKDVTKHNTCCAEQDVQCGDVCDTGKSFQEVAKCRHTCNEQLPLCYKKHSKRVYDNIKHKAPNFKWMKAYCRKKKNRRGEAVSDCCIQMHDRCYYSCMGYPDTKEVIDACTDRCSKSLDMCQGK